MTPGAATAASANMAVKWTNCAVVVSNLALSAEETGVRAALLFGGVMSSERLRLMLLSRAEKRRLGLSLYFGRPELSGDNAVGVAHIGLERMK